MQELHNRILAVANDSRNNANTTFQLIAIICVLKKMIVILNIYYILQFKNSNNLFLNYHSFTFCNAKHNLMRK